MGGTTASKPAAPSNKKSALIEAVSEHDGGINCMALSEDHSILATGSEDGSIRLWTAKTKKCQSLGVLSGHKGYITCLLIEEVFVLSGSSDCDVIKWNMATCQQEMLFQGHTGRINRLVSTGDFIFSTSNDATLKCWDLDTGELVREFVGHQSSIFPVLFLPCNETDSNEESSSVRDVLITGSTDQTARSWSFETGEEMMVFAGHQGIISNLATTLEGRLLFTASSDCSVRSWRMETGEVLKVYEGHSASVICLTIVNRTLYTGGLDRVVRGWSVDWMTKEFTEFKGHSNTISNLSFYEGMIFAAGGDGTVTCYDAKTAESKKTFRGTALTAINCMKLYLQLHYKQFVDSRMFTGSTDGVLRVWSLRGLRRGREEEVKDVGAKGQEENKENH